MKEKKIILPPPMGTAPLPVNMAHPATDPQGSYTGVPADHSETPVQDADDL